MFTKVLPPALFAALFCGAIAYKNLQPESPAPGTADLTASPAIMAAGQNTPSVNAARFQPAAAPNVMGFEQLASSGVLSGASSTSSRGGIQGAPIQGASIQGARRPNATTGIPMGVNPVGMSFLSGDQPSQSSAPVVPGGMTANPFVK